MESTERTVPYSIDAEEGVLGSILLDSVNTLEILRVKKVDSEDFFLQKHRLIYDAIMAISQRNGVADALLVGNYLRENKRIEEVGGDVGIHKILDKVTTIAHCSHYIDILKQKSDRRKIINIGTSIVGLAYQEDIDIKETISKAQIDFFDAARIETSGMSNNDAILNMYDEYKRAEKKDPIGLPCFLGCVNDKLGRFRPGKPYYIAAPPGGGKSTWAANQVAQWISGSEPMHDGRKVPTAVWSGEMDHGEFISLIISHMARISKFGLTMGGSGGYKLNQWMAKAKTIVDADTGKNLLPLYIEDRMLTIDDLCIWARMMQQRFGIEALVIDYVQIIRPPMGFKGTEKQAYDYIANSLRDLAKETGLTLLILSQLTKAGLERDEPQPQDLYGTGMFEQTAYGIFLIYKLDEQWYCNIGKNRGGLRGKVEIDFSMPIQTFNDPKKETTQGEQF